jgi:hypothetical protein
LFLFLCLHLTMIVLQPLFLWTFYAEAVMYLPLLTHELSAFSTTGVPIERFVSRSFSPAALNVVASPGVLCLYSFLIRGHY